MADLDLASFRREHAWVRIRMLGWILFGLWQTFLVVDDIVPTMLETPAIRLAGHVTGLVGLILVAWGFERIVAEAHQRQGEAHGRPNLQS